MKCENCGAKIQNKDKYCPYCGRDIPEYKPLQNRYLRGKYQEDEEDLLFDNEVYYHSDEAHYHHEYENVENEYQNMEYDDYEVNESQSSSWSLVVLLLIVALLIGFVMGFIFFAGKLMNVPSVP